MLRLLVALLSLTAFDGPAESSQPIAQSSPVTGGPWLLRPPSEGVSGYMPRRARDYAISGRAVVDCDLSASGIITACRVIEEKPRGWGFGPAAVRAATRFQARARLVEGVPVNSRITIPITFLIPVAVTLDCAVGGTPDSCRVVSEKYDRRDVQRGAGQLALAAIQGREPPRQALDAARNGRFVWVVEVTLPVEDCPVSRGLRLCHGAPEAMQNY